MNITRLTFSLVLASVCISCSEISEDMAPGDRKQPLESKLAGEATGDILPGSVYVKIDSRLAARMEEGDSAAVAEEVLKDMEGIRCFRPALDRKPKNMEVARRIGLDRWYRIGFDESVPAEKVAKCLAMCTGVQAIQYSTPGNKLDELESYPVDLPPASRAASAEAEEPAFNDPLLEKQWNLVNNGDKRFGENTRAGADVGVKDAWKLTAGDPRIIVAVMDEGVYEMHPDLKNSLWVNEEEKGNDEDGNGYKNDRHGWNFFDNKALLSPKVDHGTHVAGIIAATNNNAIGVSSIAGGTGNGDGVRIMSCQLFYAGSKTPYEERVMNAFIYAADNGASIAQCSYGIDGGVALSDKDFLEGKKDKENNVILKPATMEYEGIQYFIAEENANCPSVGQNLVVFAAGNNSAAYSSYPGALPCCISVTAFGPDFLPGGYSNWGAGCNIAAPGGDKLRLETKEEACQIVSCGNPGQKEKYVAMHGTSMACPHVSGVAALGMSYAMKIGKTFTSDEFKSLLLTSVQDIDQYLLPGTKLNIGNTFDVTRYKGKMGTGAIDAYRFLMAIEGTPSEIVKVGQETSVDLRKFFGEGAASLKYLGVEYGSDTEESLDMEGEPVINDGKMTITCKKVGAGKITVRAIAGGQNLGGYHATGGSEIKREISILSRPFATRNGGWF